MLKQQNSDNKSLYLRKFISKAILLKLKFSEQYCYSDSEFKFGFVANFDRILTAFWLYVFHLNAKILL